MIYVVSKTVIAAIVLALTVSCAANTAGGPPIAGPSPSSLQANKATLTFSNLGPAYAQTLVLSESENGGTITESDTCSIQTGRVVDVALPSPPASQSQVVVTPATNGSCTVKFMDAQGATVNVGVVVAAGT